MGQVWEAHDCSLNRPAAVKKMTLKGAGDEKRKEKFLKEARTLASMQHPNIVDIYEIIDVPSGTYMVFEMLKGKTLQQILAERKRMTQFQTHKILNGVCDALIWAHEQGIVHRDLKPANIMVTVDGQIKVMDFGIARAVGDVTDAQVRAQSPSTGDRATFVSQTSTIWWVFCANNPI